MTNEALINRVQSNYENLSSKYSIKEERSFERQYFIYYLQRLNSMRDKLEHSAKKKWGNDIKIVKVNNLSEDNDIYVVGTIFKHMELQRSVLKEISKERNLVFQPVQSRYTSDTDELYLEDDVQRTPIKGNDVLQAKNFVTGVVVAIKGREIDGVLNVSDVCYAQWPEYIERPLLDDDKYIIFVSGLTLARTADSLLPINKLVDLLTGNIGGKKERKMMSKVVRLVIAGNSISYATDEEERKKIRYRRKDVKTSSMEGVEILDEILEELTSSLFVDIMPGIHDPCTTMLPQQPLHSCVFPKSSVQTGLTSVTNPYEFSIDGTRFLGTSGQNITSISQYSTMDDPIEIMEATLNWGHIIPSSPDVLLSYPFYDKDPFNLTSRPHVYFAGNQPYFGSKIIKDEDGNPICLVSIPSFNKTFTAILLNLKNLECLPLAFNN